jgi:riboflavin biosynthesis protein ribF
MNELLGRKYCVSGEVIKGRRIGHAIGFPTANVDYQSYFLPCHGVYIVKAYVHGQGYMGMCNIGYNPTFTALDKPSLEVNILDFDGDIYHQYMIVEFYCLIRKEKPFASKEELIAQLYDDKQKVREYFKPQDKCPMV